MAKEMTIEERGDMLLELLAEIKKLVPTFCFIGKCDDGANALMLTSRLEDSDAAFDDICDAIFRVISGREDARKVLLIALGLYLSRDPVSWMQLKSSVVEIMAKKEFPEQFI